MTLKKLLSLSLFNTIFCASLYSMEQPDIGTLHSSESIPEILARRDAQSLIKQRRKQKFERFSADELDFTK